jgi:type II secretory pathway pseudopilin PulG
LIVVVAIIGLVLGIGLPAFNSMSASSRLVKTRQLVTGTLARAHAIALSDRTHTAVRFMPSAWEVDDSANSGTSIGNRNTQLLATYRYVTSSAGDPANIGNIRFSERLERIKNGPSAVLPGDSWVAPAEALDANGTAIQRNGASVNLRDAVLSGRIGQFELNADRLNEPAVPGGSFTSNNGEQFLDADDFLIVFDPETGVVGSQRRVPWRLLGYDPRPTGPTSRQETPGDYTGNPAALTRPYQRMNYTGVVIYPREPFVALGADATPLNRFNLLSRMGKKYIANKSGGGLLEGN